MLSLKPLSHAARALLLCLCAAAGTRAQSPAPASANGTIAITHVSVVDVRNGRLLPDQTVVIVGERIARVSPSMKVKIPLGAVRVDGHGLFLMPGLIDSHVHLNNPERETPMLVANGVTLVRDMGGELGSRLATREQARRGDFYGLEVLCVGTILDGNPPYHAWSRACGTPDEARAAVRELARAHVDQIKVYALLKPEVHRAICEEAQRQGLKVVGHVPDALTLENAVAAGQRGVEHLTGYRSLLESLLGDDKPIPGAFDGGIWARYPEVDKARLHERLLKLAATGTAQCPTLVLHAGQARLLDAQTQALWTQYATPDDRGGWSQIPAQYAEYGRSLATAFPALQQTVKDLSQAGVPILIGTDLGNPGILAGFAVHTEMQYWQDAGLSPAVVLRAATVTPAHFLGVQGRLGSCAAGKTASLVLTRKNPLQDVRNAGEIEAVFARGRYFNRAALHQLLQVAQEEVRAVSPAPVVSAPAAPPGEIIAQGRYNLFYQQYGDGTEDFAISRQGDRYHFQGMRQQPGFGRYTSLHTGEWNHDFTPQQVVLSPQVLLPTVEHYQVTRGLLTGDARRGGKTLNRTRDKSTSPVLFRSPVLSMDFFFFHRIDLKVGEKRSIETILLAQAGWKPKHQTLTLTRRADEEVTLPSHQTTFCRHYSLLNATQPDVKEEVWVSRDGLPIKQETMEGSLKRSALLTALPLQMP